MRSESRVRADRARERTERAVGGVVPRTLRSFRTTSPVPLPAKLDLTTSRGRRWRDLVMMWAAQLGEEKMRDETIKARLGSLVLITLRLEDLQEESVCGPSPRDSYELIHLAQEQRSILRELGLSTGAVDGSTQSDLHAYLQGASS